MAAPTVDTFEHDIANEIRQKEASIADIATAVGDIGNTETEAPPKNIGFLSIVVVLIICGIAGVGYVGYLYSNGSMSQVKPKPITETETKKQANSSSFEIVSSNINQAVGNFLTNTQKTKTGFVTTVTSYPPVFAYMIKNESKFGDELGLALGNNHTVKKKEETTLTSASTTQTGTSTIQASSTQTAEEELVTTYVFSDITISNQNMRIAKTVYGSVVYAFIGTQRLVISTSTEGVLALRSSLLQK